jgi:hypothetical protein
VPIPDPSAGDRLFAWVMHGYNAEGGPTLLHGFMYSPSHETCVDRLRAGDALIHVREAKDRPTACVDIAAWEIGFEYLVPLLRANNYQVALPLV